MNQIETFTTDVIQHNSGSITINGTLGDQTLPTNGLEIIYWAANPPDYRQSFSGSALPFVDQEMAFENTPNRGKVGISSNGTFSFRIKYPNSYYVNVGNQLIGPYVHLQLYSALTNKKGRVQKISLGQPIPFRSLRHEMLNRTPMFYQRSVDVVRTQEKILYDCEYPSTNSVPSNFWGTCPSHP